MSKITTYPKDAIFDAEDVILKDGINGTKTMLASNLFTSAARISAGSLVRRNLCYSMNLGSDVTSAMVSEIEAGTFRNLPISSYFTFENFTYAIADINYYGGIGASGNRRSSLAPQATPSSDVIPPIGNHLVMIVRSAVTGSFPTAPMNDTDTTEGGYLQSKMYTEYLDPIRDAIANDFGNLVIPFTQVYPTDAAGTSYEYVTDTVHLMSEVNMYGHNAFGRSDIFSYDYRQYALFALHTSYHSARNFWFRDIVSSTEFAYHERCGMKAKAPASTAGGIVAVFLIGQAVRTD